MHAGEARLFWWRQRTRPLLWWPLRPWLARRGQRRWQGARGVCLFLSPPRSGHSLLGALLDAHPDAAIGHELDALLFLRWGWRLEEVLPLMERSARQTAAMERLPGGYSYRLQGQGQLRRPLLVGDKHGEATLVELEHRPWLAERLQATSPLPLLWLRTVRHPLDNIASIARQIHTIAGGMIPPGGTALQRAERYYFLLADRMAAPTATSLAGRLLDVRHEDLLADPASELRRIATFLQLEPDPTWLEHCQALIHPEPNLSRHGAPWEPGQQQRILERCARYPFLAGYGRPER
ncbi:MAG: sulfotransferase family protein [Cyanobacteriota bacterium]|jgi:hypothetical protein